MAVTEVETEDTTTSDSSESSNTDSALSPEEQRDIATFARHGLGPDGLTPLSESNAPQDEPEDEPDATDDDDGDKASAVEEKEDDVDDEDEGEISEEQLQQYVDALLELDGDRLAQNPKLRARIEEQVRQQVEEDYAARQRAASASQEIEQLTRQGREAVERVFSQLSTAQDGFAKASAELAKAVKGEEFNAEVLKDASALDPKEFERNLGLFAAAATADSRRSYDGAFSAGFKAAADIAGPISDEERETIMQIVNTANRIEGDEKQGDGRFDKAKLHLYTETWKLTTERAYEAGRAAAIAEAQAKRAARKTVLDADAVIAGAAKEAKARKGLPPPPTNPGAVGSEGEATMEAYQAAKRAGNFDLADEIMNKMQMTAPAEAQRRLRR